jgi:hypothetical protein
MRQLGKVVGRREPHRRLRVWWWGAEVSALVSTGASIVSGAAWGPVGRESGGGQWQWSVLAKEGGSAAVRWWAAQRLLTRWGWRWRAGRHFGPTGFIPDKKEAGGNRPRQPMIARHSTTETLTGGPYSASGFPIWKFLKTDFQFGKIDRNGIKIRENLSR